MRVGVQLFLGEDCTLQSACEIKFNPNLAAQQFEANSKYYLLNGQISLTYLGEQTQTVSSPYGSSWTPYDNSWELDKPVKLIVSPSTCFMRLSLVSGDGNTAIDSTSSVMKLNNSSARVSMNANSLVIVVGSSYSVDGNLYSGQRSRVIPAKESREVEISTADSCQLIYIEPL